MKLGRKSSRSAARPAKTRSAKASTKTASKSKAAKPKSSGARDTFGKAATPRSTATTSSSATSAGARSEKAPRSRAKAKLSNAGKKVKERAKAAAAKAKPSVPSGQRLKEGVKEMAQGAEKLVFGESVQAPSRKMRDARLDKMHADHKPPFKAVNFFPGDDGAFDEERQL